MISTRLPRCGPVAGGDTNTRDVTMNIYRFEDDGFAILEHVLDDAACVSISASLTQLADTSVGARGMLD